MRVSVVVPTYNRADKLQRALASVFTQTRDELELIVVDDGSRDHTRDVVGRFKDPRLTYIRHGSRLGASAARNTGLRAATGLYIAFLDSDDEWLPTKIERQLEVFASSSSTTGLVYTGAVYVRPGHAERLNGQQYRGTVTRQLLVRNFVGSTSVGMIRRDVFDVVGGFDETFDALQDFDLWLRISCHFQVDFAPEVLVRIHTHEGAERISNNAPRKLAAREACYTKHRELFRTNRAAHRYHARTARLYLRLLSDRTTSRRFSRYAIQDNYLSPRGYLSYAMTFIPEFLFSGFHAARQTARRLEAEIPTR